MEWFRLPFEEARRADMEIIKCEFQVNTRRDIASPGKIGFKKLKLQDCADPAAYYRCTGELTSLEMALCNYHRDFCRTNYKWILTRIERKTDEQSIQQI